MTLDQFLILLATIFGAVGSIYVLKSILRLTPEITERLSATMVGHNVAQIDSLSSQKAEGVVGFSLIIIALLHAIGNTTIIPSRIIVHNNRLYAILIAFFLSSIVWLLLFFAGKAVDLHHRRATARIIIAKELDDLLKRKNIRDYDIKSLRYLNERYNIFESTTSYTNKEFLHFLAEDVGRTLPEDMQIEGDPSDGQPKN
jgi:hypothetical protein